MRQLGLLGGAGVVIGVVGIIALPAAAVFFAVFALAAAFAVMGAYSAKRYLRIGEALASNESRTLEMTTWPYRTARALRDNGVLVTLDDPGSANRTPLAEFKAVWATPGLAHASRQDAQAFGSLARHAPILIISSDGCAIGRLRRVGER